MICVQYLVTVNHLNDPFSKPWADTKNFYYSLSPCMQPYFDRQVQVLIPILNSREVNTIYSAVKSSICPTYVYGLFYCCCLLWRYKTGVTNNVSSIGKSETAKETTILQWCVGGRETFSFIYIYYKVNSSLLFLLQHDRTSYETVLSPTVVF